MTKIIGIDPGVNGAIVLLSNGLPTEAWDMPTKPNTKNKKTLDEVALAKILAGCNDECDFVFMENVQPIPGMSGSSGAFQYGKTVGATMGIVVALGYTLHLITPTQWKRAAGLLKTEKPASLARSRELWPNWNLTRVKDVDKAEAAMIAHFGAEIRGVS